MHLGINPITNSSAQYRNNPKFGMAIKLDKSAIPVLKEQFVAMSNKKDAETFISDIRKAVDFQKPNPVSIVIRAVEDAPGKLGAEIVDSKFGKELGMLAKRTVIQSRIGDTEFINIACNCANALNIANLNTDAVMRFLPLVKEAKAKEDGMGIHVEE